MYSKFMHGSGLLESSNTIPGCRLTASEKEYFNKALKVCADYGLDFFPTIIEKVRYDEMSELAAYGGFPERYPHWSFGMQYEELQKGYEYNQHKIYEMVVNTSPCKMYLLSSNTLLDNILVVVHATGHNDFFKNNINFEATDRDMISNFANHGSRIRRYMARWGRDKVTEFIDHVRRLDTLIDPAKAWQDREIKEPVIRDKREYEFPRRFPVGSDRRYMDPWLNTKEHLDKERDRIEKNEVAQELELFTEPDKDIFGFIKDNAPLKPWQADIVSMLYEEAMYFAPQRATKTINEGWASFVDYELMAGQRLAAWGQEDEVGGGIVEYAKHKMGVLGGKYSMNPYKVGYSLFMDIKDRWNKGKFGPEWEECRDMKKRANWDLKLNKGKEKCFEVRRYYNDLTMINEFFTQEFCDENEFFEWKHYPNGEYKIESRDAKRIKKKLLANYMNGGLPDIRLADPNHKNRNWMLLQHYSDGRIVHEPYARAVLTSLHYLWRKEVLLATKNRSGEEIVYICGGSDPDKDVMIIPRGEYERKW